jgi:hypothetical protein
VPPVPAGALPLLDVSPPAPAPPLLPSTSFSGPPAAGVGVPGPVGPDPTAGGPADPLGGVLSGVF